MRSIRQKDWKEERDDLHDEKNLYMQADWQLE
jgi:hypothetical protein